MNELPEKTTMRLAPASIGILAGIKGFVVWIGGALAGITAIFYACGYLVTRSHLRMLGLYGFIEFDNDHFLQEGVKFLITIAYELDIRVQSIVVGYGRVLVLLAIVALLAWGMFRRLAQRLLAARLPVSVQQWVSSKLPRHVLAHAAYVCLFAAAALVTHQYLARTTASLGVSDLLYSSHVEAESCESNKQRDFPDLRMALRCGTSKPLRDAFARHLSYCLALALITGIAWYVVMTWHQRGWFITPFVLSMGLALLLLPMTYGMLRRPTLYPIVEITPAHDSPDIAQGTTFLLGRSQDDFIVWNEPARRVIWIPASTTSRAEIIRMRNLFAPSPTHAGSTKEAGHER